MSMTVSTSCAWNRLTRLAPSMRSAATNFAPSGRLMGCWPRARTSGRMAFGDRLPRQRRADKAGASKDCDGHAALRGSNRGVFWGICGGVGGGARGGGDGWSAWRAPSTGFAGPPPPLRRGGAGLRTWVWFALSVGGSSPVYGGGGPPAGGGGGGDWNERRDTPTLAPLRAVGPSFATSHSGTALMAFSPQIDPLDRFALWDGSKPHKGEGEEGLVRGRGGPPR